MNGDQWVMAKCGNRKTNYNCKMRHGRVVVDG